MKDILPRIALNVIVLIVGICIFTSWLGTAPYDPRPTPVWVIKALLNIAITVGLFVWGIMGVERQLKALRLTSNSHIQK